MKLQTSVFEMRPDLSTVNFLVEDLFENVNVPKSKFKLSSNYLNI